MSRGEQRTYHVRYYAGPYGGVIKILAADAEDALRKARATVRSEMSLPMYADGYRVVDP